MTFLLLRILFLIVLAEGVFGLQIFVATNGTDSISCGNSSSPCQSVPFAVSKSSPNDVIYLFSGTYVLLSPIQVNWNLTISGYNPPIAQIEAGFLFHRSCFEIGNTSNLFLFSVTIKNIELRSCNTAIVAVNFNSLFLLNVAFLQNNLIGIDPKPSNTAAGGALFISNVKATQISFCTFDHNVAYQGGAIFHRWGTLHITETLFQDNQALSRQTASITDSVGGAVASFYSNFSCFSCTFIGNKVISNEPNSPPPAFGGAIFLSTNHDVWILNSTFDDNQVNGISSVQTSGGGAICIQDMKAQIRINSCNFTNNFVMGSLDPLHPVLGGALLLLKTSFVSLENCLFNNNSVVGYSFSKTLGSGTAMGGAIAADKSGVLSIEFSSFSNNFVKGGDSIGNCGYGEGGAVFVNTASHFSVRFSSFTRNMALGGDISQPEYRGEGGFAQGGAIFTTAISNVSISMSTFLHNLVASGLSTASGNYAYGGALSITSSSAEFRADIEIFDSLFRGCFAIGKDAQGWGDEIGGGAIYLQTTISSISAFNLTFVDNAVYGSNVNQGIGSNAAGAAILLRSDPESSSSSLSIRSSNFTSNSVRGGLGIMSGLSQGGAIAVYFSDLHSTFSLDSNFFSNNSAIGATLIAPSLTSVVGSASGGAIFLQAGRCTIESCIFISNTATSISFDSSNALLSSVMGGAITHYGISGENNILNTYFIENVASIVIAESIQHNFSTCPGIIGGSSLIAGGAIAFNVTDQDLTFHNFHKYSIIGCSFTENSAQLAHSSLNCLPTSSTLGGAIALNPSSRLTNDIIGSFNSFSFQNCTFIENFAVGTFAYGGTLYDGNFCNSEFLSLSISKSRTLTQDAFNSNSFGGAIFFESGPNFWANNSIDGASSGYGAAISIFQASCPTPMFADNHSRFAENVALLGGGVIYYSGWGNTSTLIQNQVMLSSISEGNRASYGDISATTPTELICTPSIPYLWNNQIFSIDCYLKDIFYSNVFNPYLFVFLNRSMDLVSIRNTAPDITQPDPLTHQYTYSSLSISSQFGLQYVLSLSIEPGSPTQFVSSFSVEALNTSILVRVLACPPGYETLHSSNQSILCIQCDPLKYNFNGLSCDCPLCSCPANDQCMHPPTDNLPTLLFIISGYWSHPDWIQPEELISCKNKAACLNFSCTIAPNPDDVITWLVNCTNPSGQSSYCAEGYTNRLCSECDEGWYEVGGKLCLECRSNTTWVIPFILVGLLCLIITLAFRQNLLTTLVEIVLAVGGYLIDLTPLWLLFLPILLGAITLINAKIKKAPVGTEPSHETSPLSAGIVKSFLFYSQFTKYLLGSNTLGSAFGSSGGGMSAILKITGIECVVPSLFGSYLGRFTLYLFLPFLGLIIAVLVLLLEWIISKIKYWYRNRFVKANVQRSISENDSLEIDDSSAHLLDPVLPQMSLEGRQVDGHQFNWSDSIRRVSHGFLFYCFLIYTDLSDKLFQVTNCDEYGYIEEVPYIRCAPPIGSPDFYPGGVLFICAMIYLLLFTIGLPLSVALILYRHRHTLLSPETEQSLGFLYEAFRPRMYLWGIFGFARSFILLCLIIYVPAPSPAYLLSITFALCLLLLIQQWMKPFLTSLENWIEQFSILALLILHVAAQYSAAIDIDRLGSSLKTFTPSQMFIFIFNVFCIVSFLAALLLPTWKGLSSRMQRCCQNAEPQANEAAEQNEKQTGYASLLQTTDSESE